jgi:hypothetical protein
MYWCCAQVEPCRERLASYTLGLAGYEIYQPLLREQRRGSHGRKIIATPPLFPGYLFVWVVRGWWDARWSPGVVRLVMDGHVPDVVISEIRSRERGGFVELPKSHGLTAGEGSAGAAARSDWAARCLASARARARPTAAAGWVLCPMGRTGWIDGSVPPRLSTRARPDLARSFVARFFSYYMHKPYYEKGKPDERVGEDVAKLVGRCPLYLRIHRRRSEKAREPLGVSAQRLVSRQCWADWPAQPYLKPAQTI